MSSSEVKQALMKQVLTETSVANVRILIDNLQDNCFEKCVPKPGTSLSSGEQTCMTNCMGKYMAAWNHINSAYIDRLREQQGR